MSEISVSKTTTTTYIANGYSLEVHTSDSALLSVHLFVKGMNSATSIGMDGVRTLKALLSQIEDHKKEPLE